jgi:hypothetical protein
MNDEIERKLQHIREQAARDQYLNALAATNELTSLLLRGLNDALKRRPTRDAPDAHVYDANPQCHHNRPYYLCLVCSPRRAR